MFILNYIYICCIHDKNNHYFDIFGLSYANTRTHTHIIYNVLTQLECIQFIAQIATKFTIRYNCPKMSYQRKLSKNEFPLNTYTQIWKYWISGKTFTIVISFCRSHTHKHTHTHTFIIDIMFKHNSSVFNLILTAEIDTSWRRITVNLHTIMIKSLILYLGWIAAKFTIRYNFQ